MIHSKKRNLFVTVLASVFIIICAFAHAEKPRNIIFLIGDGMGLAHITAAKLEQGKLAMDRFKTIGLFTTGSLNDYVTDSAAAGTALATGFKTNNDLVGVGPDKTPLKNLFEYAKEAEKRVGFVVTVIFPHATPAAFTAHHHARYHYETIIDQQLNADIDVMIGGGWNNLYPKSRKDSRRRDERDVMSELRRQRPVVTSIEALRRLDNPPKFSAFLSGGHLPLAKERNYTLGELTHKAISSLNKNSKGFVLMVEGSQIDLQAHKGNSREVIDETVDFDSAVEAALDFAQADGNTLVVVTADHETGGFTLPKKSVIDGKVVKPVFSSDDHTASMVVLYAHGPGSELFAGTYDIADAGQKLIGLVK